MSDRAPQCEHPDAYVSKTFGRQHDWQVVNDDTRGNRFKCVRCGYPDTKIVSAKEAAGMVKDAVRRRS